MYICTQQQHCYVFLEKLTPWDQFYDFENIFAETFAKKFAFLTQSKNKFCRKSQKIVIITSTPGRIRTRIICFSGGCDDHCARESSVFPEVVVGLRGCVWMLG
jgi:hypothetical protein